MKKWYFIIVVFVLCVFLFTGCGASGSTAEKAAAEQPGQASDVPSTSEGDVLRTIDPLGITQNLGTNVLDATAGSTFVVDYQIIPKSDSYKYKYMHEAFEFIGENEYAYYSFYTPLDASLIQSAEYEVYYDGTKPDDFVQKFNEIYDALCGEFGVDNIYLMGSTGVDEPIGNIKSLPLESMIDSIKAYENGSYNISWQGQDYLVHMQILLDDRNRDALTGKPFYELILAFDKSASVQEIMKNSPDAYELDRNAVLMSIDPLALTWLDLLGTDIGSFIEGRTAGIDFEKRERLEADVDYVGGAHTDYIFYPFGISFLGQQDPFVIMVVPEGGGIYSFAYAAIFSKDNDLDSLIANIQIEYNNLCTLYGQPTEIRLTLPDGQQEVINIDMMKMAILSNQVGAYSCYWADTLDGTVYLNILNPSEDEDIHGRLSFRE